MRVVSIHGQDIIIDMSLLRAMVSLLKERVKLMYEQDMSYEDILRMKEETKQYHREIIDGKALLTFELHMKAGKIRNSIYTSIFNTVPKE